MRRADTPRRALRPWRLLRTVLWSFVGVRRGADATRDLEGVPARTIVLAAVLVVIVLIAAIVTMAHLIAGTRPAAVVARAPASSTPNAVAPSVRRHGPVTVADTMAERVRPCTECHGSTNQPTRDGFSPRIAGKPAGYLFNQLASFRDGRRTYPAMVYLVQYMTDEYLREIAVYFADLQLPYAAPEPAALSAAALARVRDLVEHGDAAREVPACVSCHGTSLSGTQPAIPGLLGLTRDYVNAQFGAWRTGKLRSLPPDCMADVARRLAPEDTIALAAWIAAQPVPPGSKPEPQGDRELPMRCGGVIAATR